jgi:hypothetical protein
MSTATDHSPARLEPVEIIPWGVARLRALNAELTRVEKSTNHQNSGRVARPVNSAYLRKTVVIASPKVIGGVIVGGGAEVGMGSIPLRVLACGLHAQSLWSQHREMARC